MDDVLHAVGETLIAGVTVVAFLTHRALRATPSVGLGVDGGNDAIFLRVLQTAGIGGCKVLLVPPPDEKVASGGIAGPPVATLQELRAQLRNNISCTKTLKPSPIQYLGSRSSFSTHYSYLYPDTGIRPDNMVGVQI